jgi:hypothetical protein
MTIDLRGSNASINVKVVALYNFVTVIGQKLLGAPRNNVSDRHIR